MPISGRELIIRAGGEFPPGGKLKTYLWALSAKTGVDIYSLERAWKGQYISKNTLNALKKTATEAARRKALQNDYEFIAGIREWVALLERVDPFLPREEVEATRRVVALMHRIADARSRVAGELGRFDGGEKSAAAARDHDHR